MLLSKFLYYILITFFPLLQVLVDFPNFLIPNFRFFYNKRNHTLEHGFTYSSMKPSLRWRRHPVTLYWKKMLFSVTAGTTWSEYFLARGRI